jgi:serine/threonine-protein kinase
MSVQELGPGRILGRYELLAPIARGGMAQVWAARLHGTRKFQRIVALKTVLGGTMDDSRVEQMFLDEASLAARIQHSNIAATLDLGEENGLPRAQRVPALDASRAAARSTA